MLRDAQTDRGRISCIGVDVGGTFTDFVVNRPDGGILVHKEPSTPDDPSRALENGLEALCARMPELRDAPVRIVHGSTIALNAVLQRRGARIALVVSDGSRDVMEIARVRLPEIFNIRSGAEEPIVPRERVHEVPIRFDAWGRQAGDLDARGLQALADKILADQVDAVAIMLMNSYLSPDAEIAFADRLAEKLPGVLVTASSVIWPEMREYERAVVACLNAEVHPLMKRYLEQVVSRVGRSLGGQASVQITSSAGGMMSVESAGARPVDTLLSGPASGASAAVRICEASGIRRAITFDMGGTSADIATLQDARVEFTTKARIGHLPLMMPVVGINSVGAGGGSIVSVDAYGIIKVGPESAGANPGPVCYGRGGTTPTVTDCYVVLGLIDPDTFLGGAMPLDHGAARAALAVIGERLGLDGPEAAAEAALRVATVKMATELNKLLARGGHTAVDHTLIPFGGAGPTHAAMLAEEADLAAVAVPPAAAVFCALGAAYSDARREFVRALRGRAIADVAPEIWGGWAELAAEAEAWLERETAWISGVTRLYAIDLRYRGQSFSISTPVSDDAVQQRDVAEICEMFHRKHEQVYGFRETDELIEAVVLRLSIIGAVEKPSLPVLPEGEASPAPRRRRPVWHRGGWVEAAVHFREALGANSGFSGPAILEQTDTSLWIPPNWHASLDVHGAVNLRKEQSHEA